MLKEIFRNDVAKSKKRLMYVMVRNDKDTV